MGLLIFYKVLFVILTYLLGAFPTAYVIFRLRTGNDIRKEGSGNVGGTNIVRSIGTGMGILTIVVDMLKGFLPLLILYFVFPQDLILVAIVAVVAVFGHDFPVYLKFKGGKGISTSYGAIIGLSALPFSDTALWLRLLPIFIILITWAVAFAASRIVSVASLSAAIATPLSFYFTRHPIPIVIAAFCFFLLTFIAHRDNIRRLIRKEEKRLKGKGAKQ